MLQPQNPSMRINCRYATTAFLILLLLGGTIGQASAQSKARVRIDSLLRVMGGLKADTALVNVYCKLAFSYQNLNPDSGLYYGNKGYDLAQKLSWTKGTATAFNAIGSNHHAEGNFDAAKENYRKSLDLFEKLRDSAGFSVVLGNIGIVYAMQGEYDTSLVYMLRALNIYERMNDAFNVARYTGNIGNIYKEQANYPKALEYYFKSLKLAEAKNNKDAAANALGNIGSVYQYMDELDKSLEYDARSVALCEEIGNKKGVAIITGNMGNVYKARQEWEKSLEHYQRSLAISEELGDKHNIGICNGDIGDLYTRTGNFTEAITYDKKSLEIAQSIGDRNTEATAIARLGDNFLSLVVDTVPKRMQVAGSPEASVVPYRNDGSIPAGKKERLALAVGYFNRALDTARKLNILYLMQKCYEGLSACYRLQGDLKKSMECFQNFTAIRDSVYSKENEKKALRTAMQYEFDKKHLADSLQTLEQQKIDALQLQRQRSYTVIGVLAVLLLVGFLLYALRHNRLLGKEKQRSEDLLLNILPVQVAAELKDSGSSKARHFPNVTVLFTDFVGFTSAGERMTPQELVTELDTCFKAFDNISGRFGIEKIKTIGDAYLAVCGLPTAVDDHAARVVLAAKEMAAFMAERRDKLGERTFQIRIGIHSGDVVAGIVGNKKFAYDIWGDTVNTAARMEQSGEAGKINISQSTYELVKNRFNCTSRGEISAKNKGKLNMYFVD
jgi:adenylate cyclase